MKRSAEETEKDSPKIPKTGGFLNFKNGKTLLESFIGGADKLNEFLNDYWEKKPLLIRKNDNKEWLDYTKQLFSLDILKSILEKKKIKYEQDINLCRLVDNEKKLTIKKAKRS